VRRLCLPLCLLIVSTAALAADSKVLPADQVSALLARVQKARHSTVLQGRMVISVLVKGQMVRSEANIRRGPGVVQLEYLTGQFNGWKIIEQDGASWRVSPQGQVAPSPGGADPSFSGLGGKVQFTVQTSGSGRVAGRRVDLYQIRPPGASQTVLIMGLDAQTGYPLRMERYSADGKLLSSSSFLTVNYHAASPQRLSVPQGITPHGPKHHGSGAAQPAGEQDLVQVLGGALLKPTYLPAGFQYVGMFLHKRGGGAVAELRYGDGMRVLSIFQMQAPGHGPGGPGGPGGLASGPRGYIWREHRGNRVIIVAADLQADELQKIAHGLQ
jgi:hypothetical protein